MSVLQGDATVAGGLDHFRCGRLVQAAQSFEAILASNPNDADALHLLGVTTDAAGDPSRAAVLVEQALAIRDTPRFRCNLGMILCHLGRHAEAEAHLRQALQQRPDYPEALNNLGVALEGLRQPSNAETAYRNAVTIRPGYAEAWGNLGNTLRHLGRLEEAVAAYEKAVALGETGISGTGRSNEADAHLHIARTLHQLGRFEASVAASERALALRPDHPATLTALGQALRDLGRLAASEQALRRALALRPDDVSFMNNLAITLQDMDRPDEALVLLDAATRIDPDEPETRHHRAMLLLREGRFSEGWRDYEFRSGISQAGNSYEQFAGQQRWAGEALEGRTILLVPEQGLGDTIQFVRYVPLVAARCGRVVLGIQRPLLALMRSLPAPVTLVAIGDPLPAYDVHCPLMSLPLAFATTVDTIPSPANYLAPEVVALERWRQRVGADQPGFRVGVVWAGNPRHLADRRRSIPFAALAPLWRVDGVRWFSLQVGARTADLACERITDLSDGLSDFAETAAAITALDLVITVDTSIAHLAGALGHPVWLLLPRIADWRWLREGDTSRWYPSMRLFRQPDSRSWQPVIEAVATELRHASPKPGATASQKLVLFEWGVSSYYGWGIYGLNLLLSWADRPDLLAASLQPIDLTRLDLDPLERRMLDPALRRSGQVQDGLRALAGRSVTSGNMVLHCLYNGLIRGPGVHGVDVRGTPQIAVTFLETTDFGQNAAARLRDYEMIVAGSTWNETLLLEAGASRVERVLQGVDPSCFHPAPRRGLFAGRFVVFSGGKLEYRKGQDLVIQAFRVFGRRHPDAVLLAAWSSPWPEFARSLAASIETCAPPFRSDGSFDVPAWVSANGIAADQFIELGAVPNRMLGRVLREADVALFPSRAEGGTNLVAMECMACGVPTILSANTGHLDLIGEERCIKLGRQSSVAGDAYRGWGTSSVEEIVATLETAYVNSDWREAVGRQGAKFIAGLTWKQQMARLGDLLLPFL
jgi:tetratricopeptide (TPR) repeat protein/glycosyltransferase involved in cell wall biosynthesis